MTTFTMIIFFYTSLMFPNNQMSVDHVDGFKTEYECRQAVRLVLEATDIPLKNAKAICVGKSQ